ncbi:MAG: acyl-CoA dehydrogenase domain protein [Actinomycetia bacterium]|nr:acyl-CoA dehydrogenase domain protein [Actinomycetes bacterium]
MSDTDIESVEDFRLRARTWLAENFPRAEGADAFLRRGASEEEELAEIDRARGLQRKLFDGGFAGVCFPREYGGLGLTPDHQRALNEECVGYALPRILQVPTFVPCAAVLLEFGTEEQKQHHIPAILKGEEIWMQFLSEPSGGSDVAGALTTAVRDGDEWVVNGSKIWTTGAWFSDYGLCLLRTNWDVPKHRGLSVFIIKIHQPGIELHRIEMINGSREFCQEFITDLRVPDSDRVGDVDQGWTVGTRWMFHEKNAMGGGSPYVTGALGGNRNRQGAADPMVELAQATGHFDDPRVRDLVGESYMLRAAGSALSERIAAGMRAGVFPDNSAAIARLVNAVVQQRNVTIALDLAGSNAAATLADDPWAEQGFNFLERQTSGIGGGTTEMARNNISERVLGMPREMTHDKNIPFRDVPKGPSGN